MSSRPLSLSAGRFLELEMLLEDRQLNFTFPSLEFERAAAIHQGVLLPYPEKITSSVAVHDHSFPRPRKRHRSALLIDIRYEKVSLQEQDDLFPASITPPINGSDPYDHSNEANNSPAESRVFRQRLHGRKLYQRLEDRNYLTNSPWPPFAQGLYVRQNRAQSPSVSGSPLCWS